MRWNPLRSPRQLYHVLKDLPALRRAYAALTATPLPPVRQFGEGLFRTFADARAAIPADQLVGFNHPAMTDYCSNRGTGLAVSDYPVAFWLRSHLREGSTVFDFGGNTGITYYALARMMRFPPSIRWIVCDLPLIIKRGRELALDHEAGQLTFTDRFDEADGADLLLASGTLQYLESDFADLLAQLLHKPSRLLVNRLPLTDRAPFFTLQDLDPAICVYRVFNRSAFIDSLTGLNYRVIDEWQCPDSACHVRYHPETLVPSYTGLYLELAGFPDPSP